MRIGIFCGSNRCNGVEFVDAARSLARLLVARGIGIVYGGGSVGLMGELADAALSDGGEVIAVIPRALWECEIGHRGLSKLHVWVPERERILLTADRVPRQRGGVRFRETAAPGDGDRRVGGEPTAQKWIDRQET